MAARPSASIEEILLATVAIIAERDISGLTVDLVAERTGVSKSTLYRRWRCKEELVLAALSAFHIPSPDPDTGSLRKDLTLLLQSLASLINQPESGKVFSAFLNAAVRDRELRKLQQESAEKYLATYHRVIKAGIKRGELHQNTNIPLMVDLLTSPFMFGSIFDHRKVKDSDIHHIIDIAISSFSKKAYSD